MSYRADSFVNTVKFSSDESEYIRDGLMLLGADVVNPPPSENKPQGRVVLRSIGCRTNQEEIELLRAELLSTGYEVVDDPRKAEIAVVNSCVVTGHAEAKLRQLIRGMVKSNPVMKVMVTGCFAQHDPVALKQSLGVHWVVGNTRKSEIVDILRAGQEGIERGDFQVASSLNLSTVVPDPFVSKRTRFSMKIQEGCDNRCAFCIVPLVRGPSRWATLDTIRSVAQRALAQGYREIVLTGTHIGQYGGTHDGLALLVSELLTLPGDFRLRLSSLDPRDLTDRLVDLICTQPRICDHIHLSVQSLCDAMLRAMNRGAAPSSSIVELIAHLRAHRPHVSIGADIIVGFPGENDDMFEETCAKIAEARFSYGHVFRFSPRPGTPAMSLNDPIPESVKTVRSTRLREQLSRNRAAFLKGLRGSRQYIIVEEESPASGLTSNYVRVSIPETTAQRNSGLDIIVAEVVQAKQRQHSECYGRLSPQQGRKS